MEQSSAHEPANSADVAAPTESRDAAAEIAEGNAFLDRCQYREALTAFERAITLAPDNAAAWSGKGIALYRLRKFHRALDALDCALALHPQSAAIWAYHGYTLLALERDERAAASLERALVLDPADSQASSKLAIALFHLERFEEAYSACERALALAPSDAEVRAVTAWIAPAVRRPVRDECDHLLDGRTLGYIEIGDPAGVPIFYFHGLPGSRLEMEYGGTLCQSLGIRLICVDRPGLGLSDYQHHRRLLDWPSDVVQLADALGIDRFVVLGVSGGGPYVCACAYALPERIIAAGLVSAMGPAQVPGAFKGLPPRSRPAYVVARWMPWPLLRLGSAVGAEVARHEPEAFMHMVQWRHGDVTFTWNEDGHRLPPVLRELVAEPYRQGGKGSARDARLEMRSWGFSPEEIAAPVHLWHGEQDPFVPIQVARYLARAIPNCHATFYPGEKHDVINTHEREIFEALAKAGRAALE